MGNYYWLLQIPTEEKSSAGRDAICLTKILINVGPVFGSHRRAATAYTETPTHSSPCDCRIECRVRRRKETDTSCYGELA